MIKDYILQPVRKEQIDIAMVIVDIYCPPMRPSHIISQQTEPREYWLDENGRAIYVRLVGSNGANVKICGRDDKETEETAISFRDKLSKFHLELIIV